MSRQRCIEFKKNKNKNKNNPILPTSQGQVGRQDVQDAVVDTSKDLQTFLLGDLFWAEGYCLRNSE